MPLSDFSVIKDIGSGSFGRAILATHKTTGEECILKEIGLTLLAPDEREDSKQEVGILAALNHPCIVRYIDSFIEREQLLYIAMEYAGGGDLRQRLDKQNKVPLPERQVLDWFVQICLALKHCHDRKILHRDLKTQNVFLTASGAVKLGDFGIARVLSSTMECCQTAIGTPYSFSPEICSEQEYNSKSDIWSLGCVLYELLTFEHPFKGKTLQQLVIKILYGKYQRPGPHYSQQTRRLLGSLLKKASRQRPSVNAILSQPMIGEVVDRLITRGVLPTDTAEDEFSHTVLHGQKMQVHPRSIRPTHLLSLNPPPSRFLVDGWVGECCPR
jgi:NIMA (never in mitosis gene a)-related kinase